VRLLAHQFADEEQFRPICYPTQIVNSSRKSKQLLGRTAARRRSPHINADAIVNSLLIGLIQSRRVRQPLRIGRRGESPST